MLGLPPDTPLITRDQVRHAMPDPDLFLAAADLVGADVYNSFVIGDSTWDLLAARRAGTLGIGLLAGGYDRDELERAGAYRVYADPADLLETWTRSACGAARGRPPHEQRPVDQRSGVAPPSVVLIVDSQKRRTFVAAKRLFATEPALLQLIRLLQFAVPVL